MPIHKRKDLRFFFKISRLDTLFSYVLNFYLIIQKHKHYINKAYVFLINW